MPDGLRGKLRIPRIFPKPFAAKERRPLRDDAANMLAYFALAACFHGAPDFPVNPTETSNVFPQRII